MNTVTITIPQADVAYVIEAVRMRGLVLADQITAQAIKAEQNRGWEVEEKKPAADPVSAPYGHKLDGTPKKRPGRQPKRSRK